MGESARQGRPATVRADSQEPVVSPLFGGGEGIGEGQGYGHGGGGTLVGRM